MIHHFRIHLRMVHALLLHSSMVHHRTTHLTVVHLRVIHHFRIHLSMVHSSMISSAMPHIFHGQNCARSCSRHFNRSILCNLLIMQGCNSKACPINRFSFDLIMVKFWLYDHIISFGSSNPKLINCHRLYRLTISCNHGHF